MVAFHQETQKLAVGTSKAVILIYDLKSASRTYVLEGHTSALGALSFSHNGKLLVSYAGLEEETVRVWDMSSASTGASFFRFSSNAPRVISSFPATNLNPARRPTSPLTLLESIKLEWTSPRSFVLKRAWESPQTFQV
eukprot:TRINITY_DN5125_c0_g1_i1.p1 TRINITY_DN5125_c0_g1~~TRINITY_DN5125_c0_g1_i1.p1  ORF type:complete len:138 (+),score=30.94 TRINITY_DN5125_c0_g1_i1:236-649(+)